MLPREHGAWAMFVVPLWIGLGAAFSRSTADLGNSSVVLSTCLFAIAAFSFFLMRYPLMIAVKARARPVQEQALRWSVAYAAIAMVAGGAVVWISRLWLLIPIGAVGIISLVTFLWFAWRRTEMSSAGEWTGIAGLALAAPGAYLVAGAPADATALVIYLLNVLYFGGTVSYIKFRVRQQPRIPHSAGLCERVAAGRVTLLYHGVAIGIVAVLALVGWVPALAPIAFVPTLCKAIGGVMARQERPNLPRLGFTELWFTIGFAAIILWAFH